MKLIELKNGSRFIYIHEQEVYLYLRVGWLETGRFIEDAQPISQEETWTMTVTFLGGNVRQSMKLALQEDIAELAEFYSSTVHEVTFS